MKRKLAVLRAVFDSNYGVLYKFGDEYGVTPLEYFIKSTKDYSETFEHKCDLIEAYYLTTCKSSTTLVFQQDPFETFHLNKATIFKYYGEIKDTCEERFHVYFRLIILSVYFHSKLAKDTISMAEKLEECA